MLSWIIRHKESNGTKITLIIEVPQAMFPIKKKEDSNYSSATATKIKKEISKYEKRVHILKR